tara:strand:+ start:2362 stop:2595 length:234 start_codon:yes stop_codon:yes gene_type:complete
MNIPKPFIPSNKLNITIEIDDVDWNTLKEMTNCGDYLDNSLYENALINGIITQILEQKRASDAKFDACVKTWENDNV